MRKRYVSAKLANKRDKGLQRLGALAQVSSELKQYTNLCDPNALCGRGWKEGE